MPTKNLTNNAFPTEAFVQAAIERHFRSSGHEITPMPHVDLACRNPTTGESWHVEAKGRTSAPGLDFQTCLGQLIQRMDSQQTRYGIALPDIPDYRRQVERVQPWVVNSLRIHWLWVRPDGDVNVVRPDS